MKPQSSYTPASNATVPVRLWQIRRLPSTRHQSWQVRWRVGSRTRPFTATFATQALAEGFHEDLHAAMRHGEAFDTDTGLPPSMTSPLEPEDIETDQTSWYDHAREYAAYKWPRTAATTRSSTSQALTDITCALLPKRSGRPAEPQLRRYLRQWAFIPADTGFGRSTPGKAVTALIWATAHSPALTALEDPALLRLLLDSISHGQNGALSAYNTFAGRRSVLHNALKYAVTRGRLDTNPLSRVDLSWERPNGLKPPDGLDARTVGNPAQVEAMLTAVSYVGGRCGPRLVAFFATMYYAMLRPSEAIDLRARQCLLPETGWGRITLEGAAPAAGRRYTDTGRTHDPRGLKHRSRDTTRTIPIPPRLVELLRTHLKTFGTAPDGRLFQTHTGNRLDPSTYDLVWRKARDYGLPMTDRDTPRLRRPYDLRHSGISLRRTASIPTDTVAAWAGNSEQLIDRIYSKPLEGFDTRWQTQIDTILNHHDHNPDHPNTQPQPLPAITPTNPTTRQRLPNVLYL